ncbi:transporter [Variovorax sp. WS11]|uniref:TolC family protein n=1 Tax=Variovorax sp. WS11 TaxID=1105204 RepID=UPI000D0CBABB|nr:TolC family protein [Variovorax sp. WS11]NDZ16052.1 TolC family protein [Variovorax sp. WS11]PSL83267.1 transporter [Variovorax sp. WS11]
MQPHFLRAAVLAAALFPCLVEAAPLTLEAALALAVKRSESARAARAGVASASEAARAAGQLPDPTIRAGIDNLPVTGGDRFSTTRDSMTMKRIGISQEWLSPEKRAARHAAAEASVAREAIQSEAAVAETRLNTALAYLDAYYAGEALKLTTLMEHHAHEELEAARARLASPTGSSQEALALTGARGRAEDESAEVRQQQSVARVTLQRWVGTKDDELAPVAAMPLPNEQAYIERHPAVLAKQFDIDVAKQSAAVAASERKPNWTWEVSYGQRTGYSDMVSFGVSIPLQVARSERQDRETAAKLALADKAEAELAEAIRAATAEYRMLASDMERLLVRIERFRSSVVTPAQHRTAAATAAYRSNQGTLVTLFEARHAEVEAQRKLLTLRRDLAKAQAQLAFKALAQGGDQ